MCPPLSVKMWPTPAPFRTRATSSPPVSSATTAAETVGQEPLDLGVVRDRVSPVAVVPPVSFVGKDDEPDVLPGRSQRRDHLLRFADVHPRVARAVDHEDRPLRLVSLEERRSGLDTLPVLGTV